MNWLQFENFDDYCEKTGQDKITAVQTLLEHLNQATAEFSELKMKKNKK